MRDFDYAAPRDEAEALALLSPSGKSVPLAGGTDLLGLMKKMIVQPERVVDLQGVSSMRGIRPTSSSVTLGALTTLEELYDSPLLDPYPSIKQAVRGIASGELQSQGTLGGELLQRPRCWYFRSGHGLLAGGARMVEDGDNRYHAIFGNAGPAKFVCPSRLAPALIALGAQVRVVGGEEEESYRPLVDLYRTPRDESQREIALAPNDLLTHVELPAPDTFNATYEVRHGEGPDYPLAAAAASVRIASGVVQDATIVLGQVAPTPWVSREARRVLLNRPLDETTAQMAGDAAASVAAPLKDNRYKVQLARVAVKRALLRAAGLDTGGF